MESKILILESEAGFRALFQFATVGILVVGRDGNIELVNPHSENLFGYQNAELIGQPLEVLIPDHLKHKHIGHREDYFDKPKARPMGKGMELFARKKDGKVFPVEISLGYYELDGDNLAVAFITDITERKKAKENLESSVLERTLELTHALEREKELNEVKSRFVSMASHEFRTPLSAILSSVTLIEKYTETEQQDKRKKHIDRIKSSVKNLTEILGDFLSLDKLEQGKLEIMIEPFDLRELCIDLKGMLHGMLKQGQVINYKHKGDRSVVSDRKIIGNILSNLLSNAIKYSGEEGEIKLTTEVKENSVFITVKDSGIGIPEEDHKNVFKMFHRAKNVNTIQGTGLGLNIVKRYTEVLDGTITFESKVNEGTAFKIAFPLHAKKHLKLPDNTDFFETPISTHWFDENGIFYGVSKKVERTIEHYQKVIELYKNLIKNDKKLCLLSDTSETMPISKEIREFVMIEMPKYVKALALISETPLEKSFADTYINPGFDDFHVKQFSNEKDAKEWLTEYL